MPVLIGYTRVSTQDQSPQLPLDAMNGTGCERVFQKKASGAQRERSQLKTALTYMGAGDTLAVWKLNRLARCVKQLIETFEDLEAREIGFRSLTESIDTTTSGGRLVFHIFGGLVEFERSIIRGRTEGRPPPLDEKDKPAASASPSPTFTSTIQADVAR